MRPTAPLVLIDTNIFISYLLTPRTAGPIAQIIESATTGSISLVLPAELVDEFFETITTKPYLARRIEEEDARHFIEALSAVAFLPESLNEPVPAIVRDPKDNYLLAHAVIHQVDYLVSGDHDLLDIAEEFTRPRIIDPAAFARAVLELDPP
ncbi:MAG: putative toxin-antitoxin system toxin component, PIN family [Thermomicrobiales bacterium]